MRFKHKFISLHWINRWRLFQFTSIAAFPIINNRIVFYGIEFLGRNRTGVHLVIAASATKLFKHKHTTPLNGLIQSNGCLNIAINKIHHRQQSTHRHSWWLFCGGATRRLSLDSVWTIAWIRRIVSGGLMMALELCLRVTSIGKCAKAGKQINWTVCCGFFDFVIVACLLPRGCYMLVGLRYSCL